MCVCIFMCVNAIVACFVFVFVCVYVCVVFALVAPMRRIDKESYSAKQTLALPSMHIYHHTLHHIKQHRPPISSVCINSASQYVRI